MSIKAVLFDWDGVLVDSRFVGYACSAKIFEAHGLKSPSVETFLAEIGSGYMAYYQKYGMPKTVTKEKMNEMWNAHFHSPAMIEAGIPLRKGILETFSALRAQGIKIGIVSSNTASIIERTVTRHGIREFVDEVCADISGSKADALKQTVQKLGVLPHEALFVEDSPQVIPDGHRAGVVPVAITGGFGKEDALRSASPKHLIREIPNILAILEQV